ncbi:hypothetical protein [Streptomyces chartreusis]|uniref:hypothetical protein n=1 Tax=Streptomyces chartreusis TaxID=1969 RepID=UPI002E18A319
MTEAGGRRHAQLRLARQRRRPDRVRIRQPSSRSRWWNGLPWAHCGAVVAAIAAIGGLIGTAIATYYGALVSRDQLEQSRKDAEWGIREQASRVTFWVEGDIAQDRILVMNRSPDPVLAVSIGLLMDGQPYVLERVSLAPCSQAVYDAKTLDVVMGDYRGRNLGELEWAVEYIGFTDRGGVSWKRASDSLKPWNRELPGFAGHVLGDARVRHVEDCGGGPGE